MASISKAKELLAGPRIARWAALLGVLLTSPSLVGGLVLDDDFHRARVTGHDALARSRLDLFDFCSGTDGLRAFFDLGLLPWFASPDLKLAFFRPLSAVLHYVEYTLWPEWPVLMHVHSLAWYAITVALAARLFRRLVQPAWAAGLAAVLYAVAPGHGLPAAWLANRNALLATAFGLAALLAHDRWRRDGFRPGALLGPVCFALGLLSGEAAIGTLAYVVAHALTLDPGKRAARALAVAPYLLVLVVWQIAYRSLGYGVHGSAVYVDIGHDAGDFAQNLVPYAVALLVGAFAAPPAEAWAASPTMGRVALTLAGLALLGWMASKMAPLVRRDKVARFWAIGTILAVLPACSAVPSNRLLTFVDLGALALVAQLLAGQAPRQDRSLRALRGLLVAVHLVLAPLLLPVIALVPFAVRMYLRTSTSELDLRTLPEDKTVVIVSAPNLLLPFYGLILPRFVAAGHPTRSRFLASAAEPVQVRRLDEHTLLLRTERGFLHELSTGIVRASPLRVGDRMERNGMVVDVIGQTDDGVAAEARLRFDLSLDDPSFVWIGWTGSRLIELAMPPVGGAMTLGGGAEPRVQGTRPKNFAE